MTSSLSSGRSRSGGNAGRLACVLVIVTTVGILAVVSASAASPDDTPAASLISAARDAVTRYAFTGVVAVQWIAAGKTQRERVPVSDAGGTLVLGSSGRAMGTGSESMVHEADGWFGLTSDAPADPLPDPSDHYDLSVASGGLVAGRATKLVTAVSRADRAAQERLFFDAATGILLRREQRDGKRVERTIGFVEITNPIRTRVAGSAPPAAHTATRVPTKELRSAWDAPRALRNGFELVDAYRRPGGGVQLYYSDGLVGMSVFEVKGTLDTDKLPHGGRATNIGARRARVYETSAGRTVVWGARDVVYACVTDASARTLDALVGKLPSPHEHGLVSRVTHFVLGPFSWD